MDPGTLDFDSSGSGRSVDGVSDEDLAHGLANPLELD
jgi:hypothetical protein